MKTCFTYLCLLAPFFVTAQLSKKYSKIDTYAKSVKSYKSIKDLQEKLTKNYDSNEKKIRSIFAWVANNIAYDVIEYHADSSGVYNKIVKELMAKGNYTDATYNRLIVEHVLKGKSAICDGYSRLFKTLCDSAGIECVVIEGAAKNSLKDIGTENESNHAWNAVKVDKSWRLIDVTWSAGYCDDSVRKFKKEYSDEYFFPDPAKLCINHFPDDTKWLLVARKPDKKSFNNYPLIHHGFFDSTLVSISPMNGVIKAKKGEKVQITVVCVAKEPWVRASEDGQYIFDDKFEIKRTSTQSIYEYHIPEAGAKKLVLYYNNKTVAEYRIECE